MAFPSAIVNIPRRNTRIASMANRSTPASVLPADTHIGSLMNRIQLYIVSFKTRLASGDRAVSLCVTGWLSTVGTCYLGFAYWPHIMLVTCIYNLRRGGGVLAWTLYAVKRDIIQPFILE